MSDQPSEPSPRPLPRDRLVRRCDLSALAFETTDELADLDLMVAQKRAGEAIAFGAEVEAPGFNLFVVSAAADSTDEAVRALLEQRAASAALPSDWVYVNNFAAPDRPVAIALPPGRGPAFRDAMRGLVEDLKVAIPAAFESDDYQARRAAIEQAFNDKQETAFKALQDEAAAANVAIIRTPFGFTLAPAKEGKMLRPDAFSALPDAERTAFEAAMHELQGKLEGVLRSIPAWDKERRTDLRALNRETAQNAVGHLIDELRGLFEDLPKILEHLDQVRADLVENVGLFIAPQLAQQDHEGEGEGAAIGPLDRYEVNLLVSRSGGDGAPVVEELHPTLANLLGRVEHTARQGVLVTDFKLIKPGALHRANGGFLLLDARALLSEPFAWTALKRALKAGEIRIESAVDLLSLTTTVSLEPDPIPLDVKVVLFGARLLYYLLAELDPEFSEHFKVLADLDDALDRSVEAEPTYARLVASLARRRQLRPLEREAVARVIERASRLAGDAAKLTLLVEPVGDLLVEADFCAKQRGASTIAAADVSRAIAQQIDRASRLRQRMQESVLRDIALIDTSGAVVGQANGLSVIELGGFAFGRPSRITARVGPGSGRVVDIEREVELGGPLHSKGVLILSGFLGGRYALEAPISLLASLVFEQSYGGVEGDSASSAELYALLSAIADLPLRQDLAITGSVNQHGAVQAIGGVNEKIEGFFELCQARGLTGTQGVLIPASNVQHLMLRDEVVEACGAGRFAIYPVATIDEGITLLTGVPAGERGRDGRFPPDTVNRRVEDRLKRFARARRPFARGHEEEAEE
ncbi:lon-related putative ATP-dependent protease [Tistlia consotensis]|uniref:endopeptidase La n=1 Tax=Tistlia consotensis USBA 355 TaxID=560819 RepID=A0A1Y6C933_9PROT|nr:AAA family ATPase [Tistlia consotensis]SMF48500.1 lon-related putative ATP-dependent protease [Tistlia consotensis USBA 355]SNR81123.1 lon-related putative ATP-dependent protease [Tistlia consotensis]